MNVYPDISRWGGLKQAQIDWLLKLGVDIEAMIRPDAIRLATGERAGDGRFDDDRHGRDWLVFPEPEDVIFWQPRTGDMSTCLGRAFALGEEIIDTPETYSFDCNLNIFASPLEWLRSKRDGIVVLDWTRAYSRLQDCPRIAVAESLLLQYRRAMKPKMPETFVVPEQRRIAA